MNTLDKYELSWRGQLLSPDQRRRFLKQVCLQYNNHAEKSREWMASAADSYASGRTPQDALDHLELVMARWLHENDVPPGDAGYLSMARDVYYGYETRPLEESEREHIQLLESRLRQVENERDVARQIAEGLAVTTLHLPWGKHLPWSKP